MPKYVDPDDWYYTEVSEREIDEAIQDFGDSWRDDPELAPENDEDSYSDLERDDF